MLSPRRFRISTFPSSKTTGISRGYFYLSIHRSYPLCTSGKQPRRPDREKHIAKGFRLVRSAETKKDGITFTYYPDTGNRFFGYYQHEGIWVASYSKKLLEEVAQIQRNRQSYLLPDQDRLRKSFDKNAPLNLMVQSDSLDLYVSLPDSTEWGIRKRLVRRRSFHE